MEIVKEEITRRNERQTKGQVERLGGFSRTVCCWGDREVPREGVVQAESLGPSCITLRLGGVAAAVPR